MNNQTPIIKNQNKQKFKIIPNSQTQKIKNSNSNPKIQKPKSSRQPFQINFSQKKLPQQRINSNIKIHQSNNIPLNKPIKYNKPFNSKNFNFKHEFSIYGRNNLDNSVIYDLHNAYWDVTKANRPTAKLRNIKTEELKLKTLLQLEINIKLILVMFIVLVVFLVELNMVMLI